MARSTHAGGTHRLGALLLAAAVLLFLALPQPVRAQAAGRSAVASENASVTSAALGVLRSGGNAVDAAVTAALMGGVASPTSSGIGGGGFALVWLAAEKRVVCLDFREMAPAGVDAPAFERRPLPDSERAKLTGVPGEVAGLFELHKRFGKKPWKDVVAPAADAATKGFVVSAFLANALSNYQKKLTIDAHIAQVFYPGGKPAAVGSRLKNEKLGATLTRIGAEGPNAFYSGNVAKDLVAASASAGGALTEKDLSAYAPKERTPLHAKWEGYDVYTMPPPSAGGMMLVQTLKLFSKDELKRLGRESGAYQHLVAEGMRGAIADRMRYLGDPDFEKFDIGKLIGDARMKARRGRIAIDRTHAVPRFGLEESGTHHLITSDAGGNVVALTTTVNRTFGTKLAAPQSGVVLNDELDDFTAAADVAPFGMKQSPNRPRPGARPVSSMTPTIVVRDGQPVLALGGSGGTTIATNVTQLVLAHLVFDRAPADAVKDRRFYVPTSGDSILLEKGAPEALVKDLKFRGEVVGTMRFTQSAVQMMSFDKGRVTAASDPRKGGTAAVR